MLHSLRRSRPTIVISVLVVLTLLSILAFMTLGAKGSWSFIIPFRGAKLLGLVLVAISVALSTVLFQTVTNNRILTPSIMGFDAMYVLIQTVIVFFFGSITLATADPRLMFIFQVVVMVIASGILFRWLFVDGERSLHLLVLVGIIFGILFRSLSTFMQRMLDPNEFQVLQDTFFASFNSIDRTLLTVSSLIIGIVLIFVWRLRRTYDVLTLGRSNAVNLGLNYRITVITILTLVSILVSVATALVGPVTFFGLLVVSLAHALLGTSLHKYVIPTSMLLAIVCLVGGQTVLERVFAFDTALSIIIEFFGGLVFIILLLRGNAR